MHHIFKAFAGVSALADVSFACQQGTVHALLGENGAGKSTLIKILAGAYQADQGEIVFKGETLTRLTTRQALDKGIRIIYQELNLIPDLTVAENIFLGNEPRGRWGLIDQRQMHSQALALFDRLGITLDPTALVGELTVAQQQMVEIAKALSQQADLLVMDEPSAVLAGHELERLFAMIKTLRTQGVTIIYISHRLEEIFAIADVVTVLKDGRVVGTRPIDQITRPELIQMMVGRPLEEVFPPTVGRVGEARLVVDRITAGPVHNASFTLHAGEVLGIAGMVGSGRTELARAIFGADPVQSGKILLQGTALTGHNPRKAISAGLALAPEDRKRQGLFLGQSIRHNLTLPILAQLTQRGIIQRDQERQLVATAQRELAIQMTSPGQLVQYLSGGNQQKVVLAKWLQTKPTVIILDEPTRGIDVGAKFEIYRLMRQLTEQGVAILMISSELPEVLGMSDRILVMHQGEIAGEVARQEATEERIIELATTGKLSIH
ncbi:MAG: sugar ABC transporter ATP-binding protein [Caldilinea sp. CFX5]|nr:sugar ABC transporter ATP-binding protein [Caldilinea sp. CFX5]